MENQAYDFVSIGYNLPFIEESWMNPVLKTFRFYGGLGSFQTYNINKWGRIFLGKKRQDINGYYVAENPMIEYSLQFKNGKIIYSSFMVKSDPTDFGISEFKSRYMIQNQVLNGLTE